MNAAATQSLFFGGKVLVMGDILERLDAGEERVVFAHEMSHLVNRDIWPMLLFRMGSGGIAWQKWGLLIAMITMSYEWVSQLLRTSQFAFPRDIVFLFVAWAITSIVHAIYKLGRWPTRGGVSISLTSALSPLPAGRTGPCSSLPS